MKRKTRIDRDSEDWNQVQQAFWFVLQLSLLFPFGSLFSVQSLLISSFTIIVLLLK